LAPEPPITLRCPPGNGPPASGPIRFFARLAPTQGRPDAEAELEMALGDRSQQEYVKRIIRHATAGADG